ncbi:uncharacterized protein KIAA2013 homolog [Ostrea edulis]|uniref:uncharacterized protein KIAA2013 homolog n=1 Tax=Ostrea edulis TaxID=37623 RepID=UPI0024AFC706|nr:uncharacterized protein KIAA2013 homolog [Ostrea edulis]
MHHGLSLLRRIFRVRIPCLFNSRQMWLKVQTQSLFTRLNSLNRSRKVILALLVVCIFLYYFLSSWFTTEKHTIAPDNLAFCLQEKVERFSNSIDRYDVFLNQDNQEKTFPPYVGNGKLAASLDSDSGLFIRLNRALSLPVKYYPVVSTKIINSKAREASLLNVREGIAYNLKTVQTEGWRSKCNYVESRLYAHRSRPSVLVQDIRISNPSKRPLFIEFEQTGEFNWKNSKTSPKTETVRGQPVKYEVSEGEVDLPDNKYHVYAVVASVRLQKNTFTIKPGETKQYQVLTVVNYTKPYEKKQEKVTSAISAGVVKELINVMNIGTSDLQDEHVKVWSKLWESGFGISHSKAVGALNADKINTTIYYVLSNVPAPLHDLTVTSTERTKIQQVLHYPDRCYNGHSTLLANTLWVDVTDEDDIARVSTTWMITLEKMGCDFMVRSGAEGVLQAMLLSMGSLRFGDSHLEFKMEPKDLHRDLFFHRINYGNNSHLNISVIVGDDNKASIYVALDRNDRPYYACDAGCIDPPMQLSRKVQQFPVKLTEPLTAILYITADRVHMEELKHVLHLQSIKEAPPHEHHVIALHKHGHHFGGLPLIFWISVAFLVVVFHLFLVKLIINEYCQGQERYTGRRKGYNV